MLRANLYFFYEPHGGSGTKSRDCGIGPSAGLPRVRFADSFNPNGVALLPSGGVPHNPFGVEITFHLLPGVGPKVGLPRALFLNPLGVVRDWTLVLNG